MTAHELALTVAWHAYPRVAQWCKIVGVTGQRVRAVIQLAQASTATDSPCQQAGGEDHEDLHHQVCTMSASKTHKERSGNCALQCH
eukprot:9858343-Alexandrium_andersonii.AAC.1